MSLMIFARTVAQITFYVTLLSVVQQQAFQYAAACAPGHHDGTPAYQLAIGDVVPATVFGTGSRSNAFHLLNIHLRYTPEGHFMSYRACS